MAKFTTLAKGFVISLSLAGTVAAARAAMPEHTPASSSPSVAHSLTAPLLPDSADGCRPAVVGEFESLTSTQTTPTETDTQVAGIYCYWGYCYGVYGCWVSCW
ncbi:MAG TPA: hypothetical protein VKK81_04735 [Candidatus Binatia bacterium]|nr:hypothetical protein [Candidatus Binatia bacterium]